MTNRVDQAKYRAACIQLRNMLALKTGPATRRPGTQMIAPCKVIPGGNYCARMEEFQYGNITSFALEWGHNYVRFYSNGAQVQVTVSTLPFWINTSAYVVGDFVQYLNVSYYCIAPIASATPPFFNPPPASDATHWVPQTIYEVPTPYSALVPSFGGIAATEVYQLTFAPINDVIYVNHPNHPRGSLTRYADVDWAYQAVLDLTPPLLDENATDITIAASSATGQTNLTAAAPGWSTGFFYDVGASVVGTTAGLGIGVIYNCVFPHLSGTFATDLGSGYWVQQTIFQPLHAGAYWELSYLRASAYVEYDAANANSNFTNGISSTITAFGTWEVHTYGVWSANIAVQSSDDGGLNWQTVNSVTGRYDRNVDIQGTSVQAQLYRLVITNSSGTPPTAYGPTTPRIVFECTDAFLFGLVQIDTVSTLAASAMVNGTTYQIQSLGTINWAAIGDLTPGGPFVGDIFQYNGVAVTGGGGVVFNPYAAVAQVITQLTVADDWVSGYAYSAGDRVGYNGVNYIALNAVTSSTAPPSDPTNWSADGWPTIYWSEGSWSAVRGYPAAITVFEQRVWCGFTAFEPQRIWGTQTDDIQNWDLGDQTLDTDGVAFDLDAVGDGSILWLQSQDALFVGFVEAEWVVAPGDGTTSISPTNVSAHRQSRWGSNPNIPAIVVGDALVFAQRQGFSLRQMLFSVVTNKYMSQDLTALSDQILNGGAIQMAYQKQGNKNGFLWVTTANGELVGMTYELDQEIFGWHRHFTGLGIDVGFESVCSIQGNGTADDEVWCVVNRNIGGAPTRFVERLNPINWQTLVPNPGGTPGYTANKNDAYYVDCGQTYIQPTSDVFTGLDYLDGRMVSVCINAQDYGQFLVAGGQITVPNFFPDPFNQQIAQIGLPFTSTVQPMNLDVDVHTGVTQGLKKKVAGLSVSLFNTLALKTSPGTYASVEDAGSFVVGQTYTIITIGDTDYTQIGAVSNTVGLTFTATGAGSGNGTAGQGYRFKEEIFRKASNPFAEQALYSGVRQIKDFAGAIDLNIPIIMYTDGPLPLTILGVAVAYNVAGKP